LAIYSPKILPSGTFKIKVSPDAPSQIVFTSLSIQNKAEAELLKEAEVAETNFTS